MQDIANHILEYQLFTPENVHVVQVTLKANSEARSGQWGQANFVVWEANRLKQIASKE